MFEYLGLLGSSCRPGHTALAAGSGDHQCGPAGARLAEVPSAGNTPKRVHVPIFCKNSGLLLGSHSPIS